jgi:hypothetical protein
MFGICEDVRDFSQHSCNVTINSHNGQLALHSDSHASDSGAAGREEGQFWAPNIKKKYCTVKQLYLGNRSE